MDAAERRPQCILIVDGEVLVRHAISDYLRQCGYVVIEAASTDEADIVLSEASVGVDIVLCHAEAVGRVNPFDLRKAAATRTPPVEVLLAGNVEMTARKAAELCDRGPQLARPYDPQSVIAHVRRLLGGA